MITLSSAENVLKEVYLGVIADQINTKTNPLFSRIKKTTRNIAGKEIRVVAPIGINGGIMAGDETSELPEASETPYLSFVAPLKNLYGRFEISDKAIRCSSSDVNSFVNLLEDEMNNLLKASIYNLSRMIYGDGSALITTMTLDDDGYYYADNKEALMTGMYVDIYYNSKLVDTHAYISSVDKITGKFEIDTAVGLANGVELYLSGSKDNEITGLKGIVNNTTLYGLAKKTYPVLNSRIYNDTDAAFDEDYVQSIIDDLEMGGTNVNFINCSYDLKRVYQKYLTLYRKNINTIVLDDGTKAVSHFGTPIVPTNQLASDECYFLNTDDFTFYELADWRWLEDESGRILKQIADKPAFTATLVKYTELLCQKPSGIAYCSGIPTTVTTE